MTPQNISGARSVKDVTLNQLSNQFFANINIIEQLWQKSSSLNYQHWLYIYIYVEAPIITSIDLLIDG